MRFWPTILTKFGYFSMILGEEKQISAECHSLIKCPPLVERSPLMQKWKTCASTIESTIWLGSKFSSYKRISLISFCEFSLFLLLYFILRKKKYFFSPLSLMLYIKIKFITPLTWLIVPWSATKLTGLSPRFFKNSSNKTWLMTSKIRLNIGVEWPLLPIGMLKECFRVVKVSVIELRLLLVFTVCIRVLIRFYTDPMVWGYRFFNKKWKG